MAVRAYQDAPPIPKKVVSEAGETIFTDEDILSGQQIFLKYGLMENGTIWGHGACLGPDFSAEYLHTLALMSGEEIAKKRFDRDPKELDIAQQNAIHGDVQQLLKQNRYDPQTQSLIFTQPEARSYQERIPAV